MPQRWSLIVEACFYLVAPIAAALVAAGATPVVWAVTSASLALAVASTQSRYGVEWLRSPISSLWIFTLGMLVCSKAPGAAWSEKARQVALRLAKVPAAAVIVMGVGAAGVPVSASLLTAPWLVACWLVAGQWATRKSSRLDRLMGNIAYGVFLAHFLSTVGMLWMAEGVYRATGIFRIFGNPRDAEMRMLVFNYTFAVTAGILIY